MNICCELLFLLLYELFEKNLKKIVEIFSRIISLLEKIRVNCYNDSSRVLFEKFSLIHVIPSDETIGKTTEIASNPRDITCLRMMNRIAR